VTNGLLSVDGSEFTVKVNEIKYTFNVELAVDVQSYYHSGFSIAESETAREVVRVIEAHKQARGTPLAIVSDHGSGNLSGEVSKNMRGNRILPLPAGPGNPKGNGTVESAFSGMKNDRPDCAYYHFTCGSGEKRVGKGYFRIYLDAQPSAALGATPIA